MAARYWVGGTAAWDGTAGTKWATVSGGAGGASVPTSADDVFFDPGSGVGIVTISSGNSGAKSITCTGFGGTLAGNASITVSGNVTLVSGMSFTYSGILTIGATATLITGGKQLAQLQISAGATGTVTLGSALSCSSVLTLVSGNLTTSASNYNITATGITVNSATAKTLVLNGSTVTLSRTGAGFYVTGSNITISPGTSTIRLTGTTTGIDSGGLSLTFNKVELTNGTTGTISFLGSNTYSNLTLSAPSSAGIRVYEFDSNQTITTFVCAGATSVRRIGLYSDTLGTRRTFNVTTWSSIADVDFRDIGMNSSRSGTRLGDCGNNNNITFASPRNVYWNLSGTQNWSSAGWAATSGGVPDINNFPLAQDTVIFDDTGAAGTVSFDDPWNIGTLDMSARTSAMTLSGSGAVSVYGDWACGTGVTQSLTNTTNFRKAGSQSITSAGQSFFRVNANNPSGTVNLSDALTTTATTSGVTLIQSTFNAGSYSVTTSQLSAPSATVGLGTGTWTITGSGTCWSCGTATITGTPEIILSDNTTTARTFIGATGAVYGKLTIGGSTSTSTTTIAGVTMTFSEIASTKTVAHTIVFPNTTTTTGSFTVRGSAGNVVTLSRTGASGRFNFLKSGSGVVSSDYLSISDSTANPADTWYAGANSIDGGGNLGWIFTAAPSSGNFLMLFM